jgi:Domain of unknown function (DUF4105)
MPASRTRWLLAGMATAIVGWCLAWLAIVGPRRPLSQRRWAVDHARLAHADFLGDTAVRVHDVRDFAYVAETLYTPAWFDRTYDLRRLETAWFILTPFSTSWRGPAHAFVSFGFSDSQYVAISVEARREAGERYSMASGLFRGFELAYIVGTERDLIGRRALYDAGEVYLYPINTTPARARQMFVEMLQRGNAVQERPEFYNTLTNNCTSNLVDHVNRIVPGLVPHGYQTILPGYADELARALGLIADGGSMDSLRARYRINQRARAATGGVSFSEAIRRPVAPG